MKIKGKPTKRQRTNYSFLFSNIASFFIRKGEAQIARKLFFSAIFSVITHNLKVHQQNSQQTLGRLVRSLIFARSPVRFVSRFIRNRTRKVPTTASSTFQIRRVFLSLAYLVRRTRQPSKKVLFSELILLHARSPQSRVFLFRDNIHKKADNLKFLVRKAKLPFYPRRRKQKFDNEKKPVNKEKYRSKHSKRPMFSELKINRIKAYYSRQAIHRSFWRIRSHFYWLRMSLFCNPCWRLKFVRFANFIYEFKKRSK